VRHLFVVLGCLLSHVAAAQPAPLPTVPRDVNARCRRPCEACSEARQRALCVKCGLDAEQMAWLFKLPQVPQAAFEDDDWLVRWSAVKAEAKLTSKPPEKVLAAKIAAADGHLRKFWCLTALLAAGAQPRTLDAFITAPECKPIEGSVYLAGAEELLQGDQNRALEALRLVSAARGTGPARVVLDLMAVRPVESDEALAALLVTHAERGGPPVGLAILRDAGERDTAQVDRLLVVYSALRDRTRPMLSSTEKEARRQAVAALAPIAPLSASELGTALSDQQASIRMAAARALARGEGRSVTEAAEARLSGTTPATAVEKRRWLTLLADVDDPACGALTRRTWRDATQPDGVRAEALVSLAGCGRRASLPDLEEASRSDNVMLHAGVMRAVLNLPREPAVVPLVERALGDPADEVLAGAARAIGAHRLTTLADQLKVLLDHRSATVRAEALTALSTLDPRKAQGTVIDRLAKDADAEVRVAAAGLLSDGGGPLAVSALARASKSDPDARVKMAATDSLRRLGVTP
jgi:HEAT repeat protein